MINKTKFSDQFLEELITEFLLEEYSKSDISESLKNATITSDVDTIEIKYANQFVDICKIVYKPYLIKIN